MYQKCQQFCANVFSMQIMKIKNLILFSYAFLICYSTSAQSNLFSYSNWSAINSSSRNIYIGDVNKIVVNCKKASLRFTVVVGASYTVDSNRVMIMPKQPGFVTLKIFADSLNGGQLLDSVNYNVKRISDPVAAFDVTQALTGSVSLKELQNAKGVKVLLAGYDYKNCKDCLIVSDYRIKFSSSGKIITSTGDKFSAEILLAIQQSKVGEEVCITIGKYTGQGGAKHNLNLSHSENCYKIN